MKTRIISINMKHFKGKKSRVDRLVDYFLMNDVDIVGVYEVTGAEVFRTLAERMPHYMWVQSNHPEERFKGGRETQKILVGIRKTYNAFFSLRSEFRTYNPYLRPGVFVTVTTPNNFEFSMLFLHLKSHANLESIGTRQQQFNSLMKLGKKVPNFIALGDLNTMGAEIPYIDDFEAKHELKWIDNRAKNRNLGRLKKTIEITWWPRPGGTYDPSNLDHVIASNDLRFTIFDDQDSRVRTDGPNLLSTDQDIINYREHFTDHSGLYFELLT